jgi:hypothetical protein
MIGLRVKRKRDRALFTITGTYEAGVVLTPVEFGSPVHEPLSGLHDGYTVVSKDDALPVTLPATERDVLHARDARVNAGINQTYGRGIAGDQPRGRGERDGLTDESPEDVFRRIAREDGR